MPTQATRIIKNCQTGEETIETYEVPDPTPEELAAQAAAEQQRIIQELTATVQSHLDATAKTRNYDGILSLTSYAGDPDPVLDAEGVAGKSFRSACWKKCYAIMDEVLAGQRAVPTAAEIVAELPVMVWQ